MRTIQHVGDLERPESWVMWTMRVLALIAAGVSLALAWIAFDKDAALLGCDNAGGFDCESVLNSRWSYWLGIPVAVPATVVYSLLLLSLLAVGHPGSGIGDRIWWKAITVMAVLVGAAAAWFVGVQFIVLNSWCPYCLLIHVSGLMILALVVIFGPIRGGASLLPWGLGLCAAISLGAGQVYLGPQGYRLDEAGADGEVVADGVSQTQPSNSADAREINQPNADAADTAQPSAPVFRTFLKGKLRVQPHQMPAVGPPDAERMIIKLFDYTCPHCRQLHQYLNRGRERYGITVLLAPVPLNKDCNPIVPETKPRHQFACDYARLAMAVWRASPAAFESFDAWLFEPDTPPPPAEAKRHAASLVGEDELERALKDPWIDQQLQTNLTLYRACGLGQVPKMIIQDHIVTGLPDTMEEFTGLFEKNFGYTPVAGSAP